MEHLLLGGALAGDKLDVVHQKHVGKPVFVPELLHILLLAQICHQLVDKLLAFDIDNMKLGMGLVDGVGDGIEKVGLAKARLPVDKQGIVPVRLPGGLRHRLGRGKGELVGGAHHKFVEGVLLRAGKEALHLSLGQGVLLPLPQELDLKIGGEQLLQRLLDVGEVPGEDNVLLEIRGGIQHQPVLLQGDDLGVVKPGIQSCGCQVGLHKGEDSLPDLRGGMHLCFHSFL